VSVVGAAYLIWLGVRAIRDRRARSDLLRAVAERRRSTPALVREGFVVGVTNPKVIIVFAALLPRFVDTGASSVTAELLALGGIFIAIAITADSGWALAAGSVRSWLGSSPHRLEQLSLVGGCLLVALGLSLAVTGLSIG
jgi:threonine/homoserine/homoserine lactone efflux protein